MILLYTFSTFPWTTPLQSSGIPVIVLQKLTTDLQQIQAMIVHHRPEHVIGIARSDNDISFMETKTINSFHKKKVSKNNPVEKYLLDTPDLPFRKRQNATHSFCNWSAFKLAEYIKDNALSTKISFVHVAERDLETLVKWLEEMSRL